jgi:hypothetical protein
MMAILRRFMGPKCANAGQNGPRASYDWDI